ncbi:unnamed protein product [Peniophora sp. CBMAI 1063]|nr:unnamed protein product [Peniophora sp. CBMAI 1063]
MPCHRIPHQVLAGALHPYKLPPLPSLSKDFVAHGPHGRPESLNGLLPSPPPHVLPSTDTGPQREAPEATEAGPRNHSTGHSEYRRSAGVYLSKGSLFGKGGGRDRETDRREEQGDGRADGDGGDGGNSAGGGEGSGLRRPPRGRVERLSPEPVIRIFNSSMDERESVPMFGAHRKPSDSRVRVTRYGSCLPATSLVHEMPRGNTEGYVIKIAIHPRAKKEALDKLASYIRRAGGTQVVPLSGSCLGFTAQLTKPEMERLYAMCPRPLGLAITPVVKNYCYYSSFSI